MLHALGVVVLAGRYHIEGVYPTAMVVYMLPVPIRTTSKFCYGLLRIVKVRCVHAVLLRSTTFTILTVTAVADFLTV